MPGSFDNPADITGLDYTALHGCLLIIAPSMFEDHVQTMHTEPGEKTPAVRATLTVLDGTQAGTVYEETLIFPRLLVSQLRPKIGKLVLGRLVQGEAQRGKNPPWRLDPATPADTAMAEAYLSRSRLTTPAPTHQQAAQQSPPQGGYAGQTVADPWAAKQSQPTQPAQQQAAPF